MLVIMHAQSTREQCVEVEAAIRRMGCTPLEVPGANRIAICVTGNRGPVDESLLARLPGVLECIRVTKPYKLVSREVHQHDTVVHVCAPGGTSVTIGADQGLLIAGPCSVETEARTLAIARAAQRAGAKIFRAGAFKPRTSPYDFQGLGEEALETLDRVRHELGMPVVTEVLDPSQVDLVEDKVDMLQVGTRNMQNFALLRRLSQARKPVLLKRGLSASLDEWLMAAEYILAGGNRDVVLCERGIRTFCKHSRNTLDLNVVPQVKALSHLPILVDPSHGIGHRDKVRAMARAALACGAHGLLVEAHTQPASAYTDAAQTIDIETLEGIARDAKALEQLEALAVRELRPTSRSNARAKRVELAHRPKNSGASARALSTD